MSLNFFSVGTTKQSPEYPIVRQIEVKWDPASYSLESFENHINPSDAPYKYYTITENDTLKDSGSWKIFFDFKDPNYINNEDCILQNTIGILKFKNISTQLTSQKVIKITKE